MDERTDEDCPPCRSVEPRLPRIWNWEEQLGAILSQKIRELSSPQDLHVLLLSSSSRTRLGTSLQGYWKWKVVKIKDNFPPKIGLWLSGSFPLNFNQRSMSSRRITIIIAGIMRVMEAFRYLVKELVSPSEIGKGVNQTSASEWVVVKELVANKLAPILSEETLVVNPHHLFV